MNLNSSYPYVTHNEFLFFNYSINQNILTLDEPEKVPNDILLDLYFRIFISYGYIYTISYFIENNNTIYDYIVENPHYLNYIDLEAVIKNHDIFTEQQLSHLKFLRKTMKGDF